MKLNQAQEAVKMFRLQFESGNLYEHMDDTAREEKSSMAKPIQLDGLDDNQLNILIGLTLVTEQPALYDRAISLLGIKHLLPSSYSNAQKSANKSLQQCLSISLQACIVSSYTEMVARVMAYGNANGFLLIISGSALAYAVVLTYPESETPQDYTLIRHLV